MSAWANTILQPSPEQRRNKGTAGGAAVPESGLCRMNPVRPIWPLDEFENGLIKATVLI